MTKKSANHKIIEQKQTDNKHVSYFIGKTENIEALKDSDRSNIAFFVNKISLGRRVTNYFNRGGIYKWTPLKQILGILKQNLL